MLLRFPDILKSRVDALFNAFGQAIEKSGYEGDYLCVYPIKVNQQRRVIETISQSYSDKPRLGLEAGSKPELLAVLSHHHEQGSVIVCNGYKDREYIRPRPPGQPDGPQGLHRGGEALRAGNGARRGLLVSTSSPTSGCAPVWRPPAPACGNRAAVPCPSSASPPPRSWRWWSVCAASASWTACNCCTSTWAPRSPTSATSRAASASAAASTPSCAVLAPKVEVVDVGGGLGVDYEGTRSQSHCSANYSLSEYANNVVWGIGDVCREFDLPHPTIISESGRALTAHHAVLVTNIIGAEGVEVNDISAPDEDAHHLAENMWKGWLDLRGKILPAGDLPRLRGGSR